MTELPKTETLLTRIDAGVVHVTLNRPERRNALSTQMIDDLIAVFGAAASDAELRAIVLRGAGGSFCAGADIKDMPGPRGAVGAAQATPSADARAAIVRGNRRFGELLTVVGSAVQPLIAVVEGAVMGGGFGLVCVSDVALVMHDARFGLPETGLGVIPAQIAPFVVQRVGLTQARRLMLTGARFDGAEAVRVGLAHDVCEDVKALEVALAEVLVQIRRCGPRANVATKRLLMSSLGRDLNDVLDEAAEVFADAQMSDEAREGTLAFVEKRLPRWAR
jgi:isohexenylglutaconyl-CoA hydratase